MAFRPVPAVWNNPQLAGLAQTADGRPRDLARFPMPRLRPQDGFRVDPALLYALALQESRFDAAAISRAGARGMVQVMPATASFVAGDPGLRGELTGAELGLRLVREAVADADGIPGEREHGREPRVTDR